MRTKTLSLIGLILILFMVGHNAAQAATRRLPTATTYYVDFEGGNDGSDGRSSTTAWQHAPGDPQATGNPASVALEPGDTILFRGGVTYRGQIILPASGEDGNPITYKGDGWGSERAIIDGSEVLDGWTACASAADCDGNPNWEHLYYAYAPEAIEHPTTANLHEGDDFLWLAQEPDMPDPFFTDSIDSFYAISPSNVTRTSLVDPLHLNQSDPDYWNDSYVLIWVIPNIVVMQPITGFVPAESMITFADLGQDPYSDRDTKYSIYNSLHALDQAGEYYVGPVEGPGGGHKLYLWPRDPAGLDGGITGSVRNIGFDIAGENYVTIEGFVIQKHSGYGIREGGGISTVSHTTAYHTGLTLRDNLIRHNRQGESSGYGGIYLSHTRDSVVENNVVTENPLNRGIFLTGSDDGGTATCRDNVVRGNTVSKPGSTAMSFYHCESSRLTYNRIEDSLGCHANGISLYLNCSDILVAHNHIVESSSPLTFQDIHNLTVYNNLIDAGELGSNINEWPGEATGQIAILNNLLIRNNRNAALNLGDGPAGYIVKNNVIDGGGWSSDTSDAVTHTSNIYTGLRWDQDEEDFRTGEVLEEDLARIFVDPVTLDYRPKAGGPAVDAGEDVTPYLPTSTFPDFDFSLDMAGNPRPWSSRWDIGVYEFVPDLVLHGTPANETIRLSWSINVTLPATTTWMIAYEGPTGDQTSPITGIPNATRATTLTGMTNHTWYTVTLSAVAQSTPILTLLSDTVTVMPTGNLIYLPLVIKQTGG